MKKRVIKDYKRLPDTVIAAIKVKYENGGIVQDLMLILNSQGVNETVFEFETPEIAYLVRLPVEEFEDLDIDDDFTGADLFED